jgi:hypothetical protein
MPDKISERRDQRWSATPNGFVVGVRISRMPKIIQAM